MADEVVQIGSEVNISLKDNGAAFVGEMKAVMEEIAALEKKITDGKLANSKTHDATRLKQLKDTLNKMLAFERQSWNEHDKLEKESIAKSLALQNQRNQRLKSMASEWRQAWTTNQEAIAQIEKQKLAESIALETKKKQRLIAIANEWKQAWAATAEAIKQESAAKAAQQIADELKKNQRLKSIADQWKQNWKSHQDVLTAIAKTANEKRIALELANSTKQKADRRANEANWQAHQNRLAAIQQKRLELQNKRAKQASDFQQLLFLEENRAAQQAAAAQAKIDKAANSKSRAQRVAETIGLYASLGAAIYTVVGYVKQAAMEIFELERTMSRVAAATGSTDEAISRLKSTVLAVSATFNVSTSEMGRFVLEMSKLGLSSDEITNLSNSAVALSRVLGEDMSAAGELVVTTTNQFGLSLKEASQTAAIFYEVIKDSPYDLDKLKTSMQYVGASARASGVSLFEASKMMQLLSNNGLQASQIGTGLRNMFAKLSEQGEDVVQVLGDMNEAGITYQETVEKFGIRGAIAAYNLITQFKQLKDLIGQDVPQSIELMIASFKATDNFLDEMGRKFEELKALMSFDFAAISDIEKNTRIRLTLSYIDEMDNREEIISKIAEMAKNNVNLTNKEIYDFLGFSGTTTVVSDRIAGFKELIKTFKKEFDAAAESEKTRSDADRMLKAIFGTSNMEEALKKFKNKESTYSYIDTLQGLLNDNENALKSFEEKFGKDSKQYKDFANKAKIRDTIYREAMNTIQSSFIESWDELNATGKDLVKLVAKSTGKPAEYDAASKQLEEFKSKYAEMLCAMGYVEWCKESKSSKRENIKDYSSQMEFDKSLINDYTKIDLENSPLQKMAEHLKDQIAEGNINLEGAIKEFRDGYDSFMNTIDEEEFWAKQAITDFFDEEESVTQKYLALYESDLDNAKTEEAKDKIKDKIDKLKAYLLELKQKEVDAIAAVENTTGDARIKAQSTFTSAVVDMGEELRKVVEETGKEAAANKKKIDEQNEQLLNDWLDKVAQATTALADIYTKYNQEMLDNKLAFFDAELEAAQRRSDVEEDILKSQLDNNIITTEAYQKKRTELEKKAIAEQNKINEAAFNAQKKSDMDAAIVNGNAAAAQAFISTFIQSQGGMFARLALATVASGIILGKAAMERNAISKRKFYPVKYADGGEVVGRSHSEGGIPFSVAGEGGYEMEGGEFIVNKVAAQRNKSLLEAINSKPKAYSNTKFFADGGEVKTISSINSNQRDNIVRAFITKRDLREFIDGENRINKINKL